MEPRPLGEPAVKLLPTLSGITLSGTPVHVPAGLPPGKMALVFGFQHGARRDVGAWKHALAEAGVTFLSVPIASENQPPSALEGVAHAMRAHVPAAAWDGVLQIHAGGPALLQAFGWAADLDAKVVVTDSTGVVFASHGEGPFTPSALHAVLNALKSNG